MNQFQWRTLDNRSTQSDRTARRRRAESILKCESLESRQLLTTYTLLPGKNVWSDPTTWSSAAPGTVPNNNDTIVFPATVGLLPNQMDDLPDDTILNFDFETGNITITGNRIALSGPSAVLSNANAPGSFNNIATNISFPVNTTATVTVNGATTPVFNGTSTTSGAITKTGSGRFGYNFGSNFSSVTTNVLGGTVVDNGIAGDVFLANATTLMGVGTTGQVFASSGSTVSPGNSPGIISTSTLNLSPNASLAIEILGTTAGSQYDQVDVIGNVNLNDANLNVSLGFIPGPTDSFTIIANDSTDPVQGTFAGLPQGQTFMLGTTQFRINYFGGDGNDVVLDVNGAPVAANDFFSLPESNAPNNTSYFVPAPGILANDSDPNGDTITPVLVTGPTHGTLILNSTGNGPSGAGSFTYIPAPGYSGPDSFTYQDSDGSLLSNIATVTLAINPVNEAPVAVDDSFTALGSVNGQPQTTTTITAPGVLANDYDLDPAGLPLTSQLVGPASHGVVALNPDGSFTYTPATGYVGSDSFTYSDTSANGLVSNTATVTLNVGVNNVAPVANDDAFSTFGDKSLFVVGPGVLANDTDANKDTLSSFLIDGPAHGMLTLSGDGSFTYTPDANYSGTDTFTYRAYDGQLQSNLATVTLTINPVNHDPVAVADVYTTPEEAPLTVNATFGVLANDSDVDGNPLTAIEVNAPLHGTLTLNTDGSFTYTPDALFTGTDTFTYRAADGAGGFSEITPVTITVTSVNHAPVANPDAYGVNENTVLTVAAPGVTQNDTDLDGDPISAVLQTGPTHGTVVLNTDGSFTYTPTAFYSGPDSFTYRVSDGMTLGNTTTVSLTVAFVNSPPVGVADTYTTPEEATLTVAAPGVLANDSDPDNPAAAQTLTAVLVDNPLHGTLALSPTGGFVYTPNALYRGTDSFSYRVSDGAGGFSAITPVTITVTPINHTPVANPDAFAYNANEPLTVAAPGVLTNDVDLDSDPLSAILLTGPTHGTVVLNSNGSFTYTPTAFYSGPDSFTYEVSDGKAFSAPATVSLAVNFVNSPPVGVADTYTTPEEATLTVAAPGVLANDSDSDNPAAGQTLTAVLVNNPLHGTLALSPTGGFVYTPNALYRGTDTFTYRVSDGAGGFSAITPVTITVTPINHAPVANSDAYSINENSSLIVANRGVQQNDTDVDAGDVITSAIINAPTHGSVTLNSDGSFTYTPTPFYFGTDTFTYRNFDGTTFSNTATVTLTIGFVNSAPVGVADNYTTPEEQVLTVPASNGVLANDSDSDNPLAAQTLTAVVVNQPLHGSLVLNADGSFSYTPEALFRGTDTFSYRVSDGAGGFSAITPVSIVVTPINHTPVANPDTYSVNENSSLVVSNHGVQQNDTDLDAGDVITSTIVNGPTHGFVSLNSDGSFTYTPTQFYFGTDTFTYRNFDGKTFSNTTTVTFAINFVNSVPVGVADTYTTPESPSSTGTTTTLTVPVANGVLANDSDPDNPLAAQTLTAVIVNQPLHGTLALAANGSFTYTPADLFRGTDTFTYRVSDGAGGFSAIIPVSIVVTPVNHAPTVVDGTFTTNENIALQVAAPGALFLANDVDNDPLAAFVVTGPTHGVVALQSNGAFTYQPDAFFNGTDTFTFHAFDGKTFSNVGTVTIVVNAVATPPTAGNDAYTTQQDLRLVVAGPGILGNDFDIDGRAITPIVVNSTQNGALTVNPDGSFIYTPNPQFTGVDSFTYRASDGINQSTLATVTITVTPKIVTTISLDPASDTGISNTDRITNDNTPTFFGITEPNLKVLLYARAAGSNTLTPVGVTFADSAGNYTVTSGTLADGTYQFFTQAFRADGLSTGIVSDGVLTIDTVAPVVTGVTLNPKTGQIYVGYSDAGAGLAASTAVNTHNYVLIRGTINKPLANVITAASVVGGSGATTNVVLTAASGRRTPHGRYQFRIISGGVSDIAGNALDGEFTGTFPTGNGAPGGDFYGQFLNGGTFRRVAISFPDFIPVVTKSTATPAGPVVHTKAVKHVVGIKSVNHKHGH